MMRRVKAACMAPALRFHQELGIGLEYVVTVSRLSTLHSASSSPGPGWEVGSWIAWTPKFWSLVFPECLAGRGCAVGSLCSWRLGKEGIVPHSVVDTSTFFEFLLVLVWPGHSYQATSWGAVLATALRTVEGNRTSDEAFGVIPAWNRSRLETGAAWDSGCSW